MARVGTACKGGWWRSVEVGGGDTVSPPPSSTHLHHPPRPLEPTLQEFWCESLQPIRQQREPVSHEQDSEQDEQYTGYALHPDEVGPEPLEPDEEPVQREGGEEKRQRETEAVDGEQRRALPHARASSGEGEDGAEDRADARRPRRAEGDTGHRRSKVAERLAREMDAALPHQETGPKDAQEIEPEKDDQDSACPGDPDLRAQQQGAECRCGGAEQDEDQGESGDEPGGVQHRRAA